MLENVSKCYRIPEGSIMFQNVMKFQTHRECFIMALMFLNAPKL